MHLFSVMQGKAWSEKKESLRGKSERMGIREIELPGRLGSGFAQWAEGERERENGDGIECESAHGDLPRFLFSGQSGRDTTALSLSLFLVCMQARCRCMPRSLGFS